MLSLIARSTRAEEPDSEGDATQVEPWYLVGGIAAASTGVALGVLGTWAVLELDALDEDPRFGRFKEGVPASIDPCEAASLGVANKDYRLLDGAMLPSEARARCADRDELIAIQLVSFPAAVVLSGLGAFLITEAFGTGPDDLELITQIGPGRFGATLQASF